MNEDIYTDVIIVDDDPMAGELTKDLLTDEGWKVTLIDDSTKAIETIKKLKPKLVISDIMMPGIDGMELCKRIKTNPETKHIKVIILSGKSYEKEKQRAIMLGAEYFITKPYNVETFSRLIKEILTGSSKPPSTPPPPPQSKPQQPAENFLKSDLPQDTVKLTIYGLRGLGSKLPQTQSKYGRQTICAAIETSTDIFILDAGSGIYDLGKELVSSKKFYPTIWLFLSHFHLDNIIGLPYFEPLLYSEFNINIVGANDAEKSLKDVIKSNLYSSFSPIPSSPKAKINLYEVKEENYEISQTVKMGTMYSNHPTTTIIYFFNINGIKIAYASDSEIWEEATALQDYNERLGKFSSSFDVLVHDAYYDHDDYLNFHHKGHSSLAIVTKFALRNKIKNLIPININPEYDDTKIDAMIENASKIISSSTTQTQLKLTPLLEKEGILIKKEQTGG